MKTDASPSVPHPSAPARSEAIAAGIRFNKPRPPDPLIILSPARSFSSVVSTMIGEHPQLYGFPELHICTSDSLEDVIQWEARRGCPGPPGLLRLIAQELYGVQSQRTITMAIAWFRERKHWSSKKLFDHLLEWVSPKIGVEKSPVTASSIENLERTIAWFPEAWFLHLTRHPVSSRGSIEEFRVQNRGRHSNNLGRRELDGMLMWYNVHKRIIRFLDTLPTGQWMRIKGEDLLSEPEVYLPQIAGWMGLRTDPEAINAMIHPENSPYACPGPWPARGGNDRKFIRSPTLRHGRVREPDLGAFFASSGWKWGSDALMAEMRATGIEPLEDREIQSTITQLASLLGYR
jgi:hypothetical protein